MKKKLIRIFACMLAFAAVCVLGAGCAREPIQSDDGDKTKPNIADFPFYNADYMSLQYVKETYESSMTKPYWLGNVIYNELALPILYDNGDAYANLLYTPLTVVSVMDQKLFVTYEEGKDYVVDKENKRLVIPEGSSIELLSENAEHGVDIPEGYEYSTAPDSVSKYTVWGGQPGDASAYVYTESSLFYGRYLSITYAYDISELPEGLFNTFDGTMLMNFRSKLAAGEDVSVAFIGDSITDGSSSTGDNLHVEPNTPCYAKQVCAEIERVYGVNVTYTSGAKGGTKSEWPLTGEGLLSLNRVLDAKPDLCVIAYGMNDATADPPVSAVKYQSNIENIMLKVRSANPNCDIILVNSFPCNPLYEKEAGLFDNYGRKLEELSQKYDDGSVKYINMQTVGKNFLQIKRYCEISSSNVNHPNDFLHRVYAMNIMTAICDYKTV